MARAKMPVTTSKKEYTRIFSRGMRAGKIAQQRVVVDQIAQIIADQEKSIKKFKQMMFSLS